jgi:High potential iron-sulfur protein
MNSRWASLARRRFLQLTATTVVAVPASALLMRSAIATDAPLVDTKDSTAAALKYVEDVANAQGAKPGSKCANCALYQAAPDSAQGPCTLFPGKQVKAAGWCSAWAQKA